MDGIKGNKIVFIIKIRYTNGKTIRVTDFFVKMEELYETNSRNWNSEQRICRLIAEE